MHNDSHVVDFEGFPEGFPAPKGALVVEGAFAIWVYSWGPPGTTSHRGLGDVTSFTPVFEMYALLNQMNAVLARPFTHVAFSNGGEGEAVKLTGASVWDNHRQSYFLRTLNGCVLHVPRESAWKMVLSQIALDGGMARYLQGNDYKVVHESESGTVHVVHIDHPSRYFDATERYAIWRQGGHVLDPNPALLHELGEAYGWAIQHLRDTTNHNFGINSTIPAGGSFYLPPPGEPGIPVEIIVRKSGDGLYAGGELQGFFLKKISPRLF